MVQQGWTNSNSNRDADIQEFKKIADSFSVANGCLLYGSSLVIPSTLLQSVLKFLHLGQFSVQRMKSLARSVIYCSGIDADTLEAFRNCQSCAEHQNKPEKALNHPWMIPKKLWIRIHVDHAINFLGKNWLIITDSYSHYPSIHPTTSTSTRSTIALLEQDFAHFGYPMSIVTDNASTFTSGEFKEWCEARGILHLTGAPYHPASNGAAERLVQTFKQSMRKSTKPPSTALQEFLMMYRRTPTMSGFSPSELLNGRKIRTVIDILSPDPAVIMQRQQTKRLQQEMQRQRMIKSTSR